MKRPQEKQSKYSGFGLIGLIIAVAVIGLLASGGLYFREGQQRKSQIQVGLEAEKKAKELRDRIMNQQRQQLEGIGENPATLQPSPSNSAPSGVEGWKTYRNEKYGFEVKYEADLAVAFKEDNPGATLWIYDANYQSSSGTVGQEFRHSFRKVDFSISPLSKEDLVTAEEEITNGTKKDLSSSFLMTIGEKETKVYLLWSGLVGNYFYTFFDNGKYFFTVRSFQSGLSENILSTFKFIK